MVYTFSRARRLVWQKLGWTALLFFFACAPGSQKIPPALIGPRRQLVEQQFSAGQWKDALKGCQGVLRKNPSDCAAQYCELIAQSMLFIDQLNNYVLPRFHKPGRAGLRDLINLCQMQRQLAHATAAAEATTERSCELDLPRVPLRIGDPSDPIVDGELRGLWTPRSAHLLAAILYGFRYMYNNVLSHERVPPPPPGETAPGLPELLARMGRHLLAHDALLAAPAPSDAAGAPRSGWRDRDGNGVVSSGDELLIDIFAPGTNRRIFEFSGAEFVRGESMPLGALTPTAQLAPKRCGYRRWHIDTLLSGKDIGGTDGMSFSPDGKRLVLPMRVQRHYQVHMLNADGTGAACLTCQSPGTNDGVRWRPGGEALLFISDRDHPHSQGSANGGAGQELYVMRSDGSQPTRLTRSHAWATNYHANWSPDGQRIVWCSTEEHTWDVMVADYIEDAAGPRLANIKRLTRDTTWWETHGFSKDGKSIIATNTRAGFMSPDLYAIDIASGQRTRLTNDPAWDEHGHLSPDGRKLSWISGRWRPASVLRLNSGAVSPLYDFFWIVPGIFFEILNHPAGYATELSLMDADGGQVQRLTFEGEIVADNEWSPDGRRIVFRQQQPRLFGAGRIRVLTFDDCQ